MQSLSSLDTISDIEIKEWIPVTACSPNIGSIFGLGEFQSLQITWDVLHKHNFTTPKVCIQAIDRLMT